MGRKLKAQKNKSAQQQNTKKNKNQNQQKSKKNEKKDLDFSLCDFPIPYSDIELGKHWFDFNDSTVEPIMPGQLQKMFGGSSANAYMLVYHQRKLRKQDLSQPQVP